MEALSRKDVTVAVLQTGGDGSLLDRLCSEELEQLTVLRCIAYLSCDSTAVQLSRFSANPAVE